MLHIDGCELVLYVLWQSGRREQVAVGGARAGRRHLEPGLAAKFSNFVAISLMALSSIFHDPRLAHLFQRHGDRLLLDQRESLLVGRQASAQQAIDRLGRQAQVRSAARRSVTDASAISRASQPVARASTEMSWRSLSSLAFFSSLNCWTSGRSAAVRRRYSRPAAATRSALAS